MRRSILACGLLLAFAGMATAAAAATASNNNNQGTSSSTTTSTATTTAATTATGAAADSAQARWERRRAAASLRHIQRYRADTRHWLTVMRGRPPAHDSRMLSARSLERLRQLARRWQHRAHAAWWHAKHPPEMRGWLCIHHYEGSWADSGSPYWGGLQMDLGFQQTYGGWLLHHKGTADHWSPLEQIWAGVRASHSRGFSPWPNTARYCGLM